MQKLEYLVYNEKPDFITFENSISHIANEERLDKNLVDHPWDHILAVVSYGKMILRSLPKNGIDFISHATFYLHDVGRKEDGWDKGHAKRGANIAEEILHEYFSFFTDEEIKSAVYAIEFHSATRNGEIKYPVVRNFKLPPGVNPLVAMTLWDADRLDLLRVPQFCKSVDPNYLNTNFAKKYANSDEHLARYNLL